MAEEWGLMGGLFVIILYGLVLAWGIRTAISARSQFQRLLSLGLTATLFFYLAINMMMVMGLDGYDCAHDTAFDTASPAAMAQTSFLDEIMLPS